MTVDFRNADLAGVLYAAPKLYEHEDARLSSRVLKQLCEQRNHLLAVCKELAASYGTCNPITEQHLRDAVAKATGQS